jgi:serine/threonine protein kinase
VIVNTELRRGTLIDNRYRIQRILGRGGFGRTYLVSDRRRFDEFCVLKEFVPHIKSKSIVDRAKDLFQREAKVLYELNHPQIPKFLAHLEDNERLFLVQEYVEGKNYAEILRDRIARGLTFSETEVVQWLNDLLPVLEYLHCRHIIHRDISPDNIMLPSRGGKPMLIDLGAIEQLSNEVHSGSLRSTTITGYSSLVGKIGYCPPEQIDRGQCYPSSDLYALAVSALVLMTGKEPSAQVDRHSWMRYKIEISDRFAGILSKMLAENPAARYQSAGEVLQELQSLLGSIDPQERDRLLSRSETAKITLIKTKTSIPRSQEKQTSDLSKKSLLFSLQGLSIGLISSALLFVGLASPYFNTLCKPLNNCARDREFATIYEREREAGKEAIVSSDRAQSQQELRDIRDRLNVAIIRLRGIPTDVSVYTQAQNTLRRYQTSLDRLQYRLSQDNSARRQLAIAARLMNEADRKTEAAKRLIQKQKVETAGNNQQQGSKNLADTAQAQRTQAEIEAQIAQSQLQSKKAIVEARERNRPTFQPIEKPNPSASPSIAELLSGKSAPIQQTNSATAPLPSTRAEIITQKQKPTKILSESDRDVSIRYANDLAYGLGIATRKREINYGTRTYLRVQTAINLLRRGKSLEEAKTRSGVDSAIVQQLLTWGQNRPAAKNRKL